MLRSSRAAAWLAVALAVFCAVQGATLGRMHHLWCDHHAQEHHLAACHGWHDGCCPHSTQWDHRHPAPVSHAHDAHNCLACRYVAERGLPPRVVRVDNGAVFLEPRHVVAPVRLTAGPPSSYNSRAPPV